MINKFKELIEKSERILITSHISPDPDSICSMLLMGTTLQLNYPDKQVVMTSEEIPSDIDFLDGYDKIQAQPLKDGVTKTKPDLIIIVDAMNYARCTRDDVAEIKNLVAKLGSKLAIIDHHEPLEVEKSEVYINTNSPAATQDVYEVCFDLLKLKKPSGYAQTAMLGIYSDSGSFAYLNKNYRDDKQTKGDFRKSLRIIGELIDAGASIEEAKRHLSTYSEDHLKIIAEFAANITHDNEYSYSFLDDGFVKSWITTKSLETLKTARAGFVNDYIRNIDDRKWGFVVNLDPSAGDHMYSVSLRAIGDTKDVAAIAAKLGGGGHKPAAGAKFKAKNVQEALAKVKAAIVE